MYLYLVDRESLPYYLYIIDNATQTSQLLFVQLCLYSCTHIKYTHCSIYNKGRGRLVAYITQGQSRYR